MEIVNATLATPRCFDWDLLLQQTVEVRGGAHPSKPCVLFVEIEKIAHVLQDIYPSTATSPHELHPRSFDD